MGHSGRADSRGCPARTRQACAREDGRTAGEKGRCAKDRCETRFEVRGQDSAQVHHSWFAKDGESRSREAGEILQQETVERFGSQKGRIPQAGAKKVGQALSAHDARNVARLVSAMFRCAVFRAR